MSRRKKGNAPFSLLSFQDIITSVSGIMLLITLLLAMELIGRSLKRSDPEVSAASSETLEHDIQMMRRDLDLLDSQATRNVDIAQQAASVSAVQIDSDLTSILAKIEQIEGDINQLRNQQQNRDEVVGEKLDSIDAHIEELCEEAERKQRQVEQLEEELANIESESSVFFRASINPSESPWLIDVHQSHIELVPLNPTNSSLIFTQSGSYGRWSQFSNWLNARNSSSEFFVMLVRPSGLANYSDIRELVESAGFKLGIDVIAEEQDLSVLGDNL
jgi:hypothetical protein